MLFEILIALGIIVSCMFISAIFSASETAFIAASNVRIYHQAKEGSKRARMVKTLRADMSGLLSFLLLSNNLVNILSASIATYTFTRLFGEVGVVYATAMMTVLLVLFAEVIPKICAINYPESIARNVAPVIRFLFMIVSPFSKGLDAVARGFLKVLGLKTEAGGGSSGTAEELRGIIEMHKESGKAAAHEREMLRSILDLSEVEVGEIMVHRKNITLLDASEKPSVLVEKVLQSPYTRFPLWMDNQDNIVGILHTKAFFRDVAAHPVDPDSMDILSLSQKPWFIPETTKLLDQLQAFRQKKEHIALVVDEYGAFLGLVTLEDILEEIVGEIVDELDVELPGIHSTREGEYVVEGAVTIRDLNRQFDWNLPDEEAATLAGLLIHESRLIPKVGQTFMIHGLEITVLRRTRNQITLLKVIRRQG